MPAKFEVYKDKKGEFRFRLRAANGETIATGESYPSKAAVQKGIASIQKNAATAPIVDTTVEKVVEKKEVKKPVAKSKTTTKTKAAPKTGVKPRGRKPKSKE